MENAPPQDTPAWIWLLGLSIAVIVPAVTSILNAVIGHRAAQAATVARDAVGAIADTKREIREIHEQTTNSHVTNLRDDVDALGAAATRSERLAQDALAQSAAAAEGVVRVERLFQDLGKSIRAIEKSVDRRDNIHAKHLTELSEELSTHIDEEAPRLVEKALDRARKDAAELLSKHLPVNENID